MEPFGHNVNKLHNVFLTKMTKIMVCPISISDWDRARSYKRPLKKQDKLRT